MCTGPVNLSVHHLLAVHFYKQVEPVFDMAKVALCLPAWKIAVKLSVLSLMHCIVPPIMPFSKGEWIWCFSFRNRQACGCHVPPSVETGCLPNSSVRDAINRSATRASSLQKTCQPEVFACVLAQWPPRARHVWDQPQSGPHK